ncbi:hypothetical protein D3C80_1060410 [compost metagenome]
MRVLGQRRGQGLQQPGTALAVTHPIEQRLPAFAEQAFHLPALEGLAVAQARRQRPLLQAGEGVGQAAFRQRVDAHQQGAGVVLAAGAVGGADQCGRRGLRLGFGFEDAADDRVVEHRPDAIADQQEAFADLQIAVQIVHHQVLVEAEGALEHVLHAFLLPDVLAGQALQLAGVPAIGAAVADVGEGEASAAQHQRGEGGEQRLATAGRLQPAVVGQQQAVQRLRHRPGFRGGVVVQRQRLQGGTGGQAAVGALADAVGQGQQVALAGGQRRRRGHHAQGVLVLAARAGGAGFAGGQLQRHGRVRGDWRGVPGRYRVSPSSPANLRHCVGWVERSDSHWVPIRPARQ